MAAKKVLEAGPVVVGPHGVTIAEAFVRHQHRGIAVDPDDAVGQRVRLLRDDGGADGPQRRLDRIDDLRAARDDGGQADGAAQSCTPRVSAPSTTRLVPVTKLAAGLARNTAALAISCGVPIRPVGLRASAVL